ncbi:hypothetical protein GCM10020366_11210 [Saccharopolyspora gregorii]|uniref:Uncharacterized protein n=1 Tax=Saccharopolyspora gregorii TaxID=33914 RepID=A0ABP6RNJ9_9PSEU
MLHALYEAPERRLRMTDLADAVLLSRSGVTRLDRTAWSGSVWSVASGSIRTAGGYSR